MNKEQEKVIIDAFNASSEKTQKFIEGDKYEKILLNLYNKFNLTDEEYIAIQIRTLYILLNLDDEIVSKKEIVLALRDRDAAEIEKITKEIDKKILIYR